MNSTDKKFKGSVHTKISQIYILNYLKKVFFSIWNTESAIKIHSTEYSGFKTSVVIGVN